jgi:hypothetical protein
LIVTKEALAGAPRCDNLRVDLSGAGFLAGIQASIQASIQGGVV